MKALKITLIATLFLATLASCTKQDLGEDDVLVTPTDTQALLKDGQVTER